MCRHVRLPVWQSYLASGKTSNHHWCSEQTLAYLTLSIIKGIYIITTEVPKNEFLKIKKYHSQQSSGIPKIFIFNQKQSVGVIKAKEWLRNHSWCWSFLLLVTASSCLVLRSDDQLLLEVARSQQKLRGDRVSHRPLLNHVWKLTSLHHEALLLFDCYNVVRLILFMYSSLFLAVWLWSIL